MAPYSIGSSFYNAVGSPATGEVAPQNGGQQLNTLGGYDPSKFSFPCPSGDGGTCRAIGSTARVFRCNARGEQWSSAGEANTLTMLGVVGSSPVFCDVPIALPVTLG
jgi:hypothetical protein